MNFGYPSKERFIHILKSVGANEKAIQMGKEFKYSLYRSRQKPNIYPNMQTKQIEEFNNKYIWIYFIFSSIMEIPSR